jgi:hypothetical protein
VAPSLFVLSYRLPCELSFEVHAKLSVATWVAEELVVPPQGTGVVP